MNMQEYEDSAINILQDNIVDNAGFLWTGGSEAQVIAHMLLERLDEDITFLTVNTGNQLDSVIDFRGEYFMEHKFEWEIKHHSELIRAIVNEDDPRGYHGEWDENAEKDIGLSKDEWTVERSCGQLKVVPLREFIEEGYNPLITGVRESDPLAGGGDFGPVVKRHEPMTHTRVNPIHNWSEEHVWSYITHWFVDYPSIYDEGVRHTDSECCLEDGGVSEHNPEGFDPEIQERNQDLRDMGYI